MYLDASTFIIVLTPVDLITGVRDTPGVQPLMMLKQLHNIIL